MQYSIIVETCDGAEKRVLRGGCVQFVANDGEDLIQDVKPIPYDLKTHDVFFDINSRSYINRGELNIYRTWCFDCKRFFEGTATEIPVACPICGQSDIADVTAEQFALRGYPVSVVGGLRGHHFAQFDSRGRWNTYMNYIQFPDRPDNVPAGISFSDVRMDGMTDLVVMNIDTYGFKYRVTSVGPQNTLGTVEFDWETSNG